MKSLLHKIFSTLMALLLLLSTTSWTVEKHMCMGRVMDVALFNVAEDCGMEAGLALLDDSSKIEKHCCDNELFTMRGQDNLTHDLSNFDFSQQAFLLCFTTSYLELFQVATDRKIVFDSYPPPILRRDLNILHQVFLI